MNIIYKMPGNMNGGYVPYETIDGGGTSLFGSNINETANLPSPLQGGGVNRKHRKSKNKSKKRRVRRSNGRRTKHCRCKVCRCKTCKCNKKNRRKSKRKNKSKRKR